MISENIKVFCRPKPTPSPSEIFEYIDPQTCRCTSKNKVYTFNYDQIFPLQCSQEDIYLEIAKPIVDSVCRGYSGTIFAYGPTNSGKTYSMRGPNNGRERGIIPRCIEQISSTIGNAGTIYVSYLQIYCEIITDLLIDPETAYMTPLSIRERDGLVFIEGLSRYKVTTVQEIYDILARGDEVRVTASTNINETSSRSHAAIMITIAMEESSDKHEASKEPLMKKTRESSLVLVDLAGSERVSASEGQHYMRFEESKAINLSLSALGNCISSLSEGKAHIPYRDSKLTRLLQGSLGGSSRTSVLINIPPGNVL